MFTSLLLRCFWYGALPPTGAVRPGAGGAVKYPSHDMNLSGRLNSKIHLNRYNSMPKARRTYSRRCLFTTRLNCREPIGSRQFSVHCPDYSTYTLTTRFRPSESLNAATWCILSSVMYMHHGAIWCLDTHQ